MRRLILVALALAVAPRANAATISVDRVAFSPSHGPLSITATLGSPRPVGVELATPLGRRLGWISAPQRREAVSLSWDGRIDGRRVRDGRYEVQLVLGGRALAATPLRVDTTPPTLRFLRAGNGNDPYAGDGRWLTTVTPNGDGLRDTAYIRFRLAEAARVTLDVARTVTSPRSIATSTRTFRPGSRVLSWSPPSSVNPRTYLLRLTAVDAAGNRRTYGAENAFVGRYERAPVVRVRGLDATFTRQSYAPGQLATVKVAADVPSFSVAVFQAGPDQVVTYADNLMAGVPVTASRAIPWAKHRDAPGEFRLRIGAWPSGFYYLELRSPDGLLGYAPFVVHPNVLGSASRVAVVLPTNTWEAYNFWDADGNGYGDTWYAGPPNQTVDLSRPYDHRGVPPRFYRYDLPFLHWLYWTGKRVDFLADSDFARIESGDKLAKAYDLVVFGGHEEYVTEHMYDVVERYRDLGGNLAFLSADNFFWRVRQTGTVLRRTGQWRQLGRPESALIGVQYRGNDDGRKQGNYVVRNAAAAPWLWDGTGLSDGSTLGQYVGGYGIEIDGTTPQSPPGTIVLAEITDLLGPGMTAQMTYYETPSGAKVFAAGTLDFSGSATFWPVRRILENLWTRLSAP